MNLVFQAAHWAAGAVGIGLLLLGVVAAWFPVAASSGYGIAVSDNDKTARGYAAACGWRDIACGVAVLALWVSGATAALGAVLAALTLIPVGDVVVLRRAGVRRVLPYLPHVVGCVGVGLLATVLLWR